MSYMLLIVEPQGQREVRSEAEGRAVYQRMIDFGISLKERGVLLASEALRAETIRLQRSQGRLQRTDGPFTESKEMVGGFYLLNCDSRAEALRYAEECPAIAWATIEVREIGTCYE